MLLTIFNKAGVNYQYLWAEWSDTCMREFSHYHDYSRPSSISIFLKQIMKNIIYLFIYLFISPFWKILS